MVLKDETILWQWELYSTFYRKEIEREREREKRFENIFEWYVRPYLIVKHEMAQTQPTVKSLNAICGTWLNYHSNSRYDIHYILFLRTHIYFSMMLKGVLRNTN